MPEAVSKKQPGDGDSCGTGAIYHDLGLFFVLACDLHGIDDARKNDDGRAVLVIMKDGDIQQFF